MCYEWLFVVWHMESGTLRFALSFYLGSFPTCMCESSECFEIPGD